MTTSSTTTAAAAAAALLIFSAVVDASFLHETTSNYNGEGYFDGHFYQVTEHRSPFLVAQLMSGAKTKCGAQGHLVSITSKEENDFVASLIGRRERAYIGFHGEGTKQAEDGTTTTRGPLSWTDGEETTFLGFQDGRIPMNPRHSHGGECVTIERDTGEWKSAACQYESHSYVIEWNCVSEPSDKDWSLEGVVTTEDDSTHCGLVQNNQVLSCRFTAPATKHALTHVQILDYEHCQIPADEDQDMNALMLKLAHHNEQEEEEKKRSIEILARVDTFLISKKADIYIPSVETDPNKGTLQFCMRVEVFIAGKLVDDLETRLKMHLEFETFGTETLSQLEVAVVGAEEEKENVKEEEQEEEALIEDGLGSEVDQVEEVVIDTEDAQAQDEEFVKVKDEAVVEEEEEIDQEEEEEDGDEAADDGDESSADDADSDEPASADAAADEIDEAASTPGGGGRKQHPHHHHNGKHKHCLEQLQHACPCNLLLSQSQCAKTFINKSSDCVLPHTRSAAKQVTHDLVQKLDEKCHP